MFSFGGGTASFLTKPYKKKTTAKTQERIVGFSDKIKNVHLAVARSLN